MILFPKKGERQTFSSFWFLAGGGIHGAWKHRKYSLIKEYAEKLPKAAWDVQQTEIDRLDSNIAVLKKEVFKLKAQLQGCDRCINLVQCRDVLGISRHETGCDWTPSRFAPDPSRFKLEVDCPEMIHEGCSYLAAPGTVCNKCGKSIPKL